MMQFLPTVVLFKIFNMLNVEERQSASDVCTHWALANWQFIDKRNIDVKVTRRYVINKGQKYCKYRSVKKQLKAVQKNICKNTRCIRHLTVNLGMSRAATHHNHKAYFDTLMKVCYN